MSYAIRVFIQDKYLSETGYKNFLQECCKIKGFYGLREAVPFDYSSKDLIHECFLIYEDLEEVFIELDDREYVGIEAVDRSVIYDLTLKRNIYYEEFDLIPLENNLYLEIDRGVSQNLYTMLTHLFISYIAFSTFQNIIVFDPSLKGDEDAKYFFQKFDYLAHIKQTLLACYGLDILSSRDYLRLIDRY